MHLGRVEAQTTSVFALCLAGMRCPRRLSSDRGGMAHWALSRTLSILGVVFLIHLAAITSLADKDTEAAVTGGVVVGGRERRSYDVHSSKTQNKQSASNNGAVVASGTGTGGSGLAKTASAPDRGAIFATENSTTITAQIGGTATLPCVVRKFSSGVVSWIRRKDYHLLTVGLTTYSSDDRFLVEHVRHLQNWGLQIKFVQPRDAGMYECQVSTHPPTSIFVELKVIEVSAEILGAPDLHIKAGSTLKLVCTLRGATEPPVFVFWYHEDRMINYDMTRGVHVRADRASSVLTLHDADKSDNGNYTCVPSNARPASINVHVLNATAGEQPAAMQHANTSTSSGVCGHGSYSVAYVACLIVIVCMLASKAPSDS